jgi:hypothetical protein
MRKCAHLPMKAAHPPLSISTACSELRAQWRSDQKYSPVPGSGRTEYKHDEARGSNFIATRRDALRHTLPLDRLPKTEDRQALRDFVEHGLHYFVRDCCVSAPSRLQVQTLTDRYTAGV